MSNYNPYDHYAILVAVLGNGYPNANIWDYEVVPHPFAQRYLYDAIVRTTNKYTDKTIGEQQ